ncbi:AMP-binding protein [Rhodococcus sp. R1101]|uniref:AMP-binding protein n=1 Tax=Rhodococcus sp. R1101 TaxID=1170698 RepID=UPI000362DC18|nr:AMP-binding protein [Rhodococcus sp. R1101]
MNHFTGNVLLDELIASARARPHVTAMIEAKTGRSLSFEELLARAAAAGRSMLAAGARPGSNIVMTGALDLDFVVACFGAFTENITPALLDPNSSEATLRQCIEELEATVWVTTSELDDTLGLVHFDPTGIAASTIADEAEPQWSTTCDVLDPILMLYTSGTTGVPKGVPWSSRELSSQIRYYSAATEVRTEFCLFPHLALVAIAIGRTAVLPDVATLQPLRIPIESVHRQMMKHGCDYVFASPLVWDRLVRLLAESGEKAPPIKIAATAGSALSGRLIERISAALPHTTVRIPFASTEAVMPITVIDAPEFVHLSKTRTYAGAGIPLGTVADEMSIGIVPIEFDDSDFSLERSSLPAMEVGEIVVTGTRVTRTYFRRPDIEGHAKLRDVVTERVWHRTADLGYIDDKGQLWFVCRKKDVIRLPDGDNFYPDAVEQMWNMATGASISAVVYSEPRDELFYVLPDDSVAEVDEFVLNLQADRAGVPHPTVVTLSGSLPADVRHNSKVDRPSVLRIVESWQEAKEGAADEYRTPFRRSAIRHR